MRSLAIWMIATAMSVLIPWVGSASESGRSGLGPEMVLFNDLPDVWSATRTLRSPLDVPNEVTVITAEDIRASGATSLVELLETVPSLDIMRVSRADVNISSRGFDPIVSSRVLAMVDGRSVYIDFTGIVLWESLNVTLDEIDRIEVIRGPGSVLYGANALLGVINIITKRPHEMPRQSVRIGAGPETAFTTGSIARAGERMSMKTSVQYRGIDDFRSQDQRFKIGSTNRHTTAQRNRGFNSTLEYLFDNGTLLSVNGGMTRLEQEVVTQMGDFLLDASLFHGQLNLEKGLWRFQMFMNGFDSDLETTGTVFPQPLFPPAVPFSARVQTNTFDAELQRTHVLGSHTFLWGVNFRRTATTSAEFFDGREKEAIYGAFLQDEVEIGERFLLLGGIRFDEHPKAGFHVSPRLSLVAKLGETERLRFLWARSFRTPSHLWNYASVHIESSVPVPPFSWMPFDFEGSEDLDSVTVETFEVGYRAQPIERLRFDASLYWNVLKDFHTLYLRNEPLPIPVPPYVNPFATGIRDDGRAKAWGAEIGLEYRFADSTFAFASYVFQAANGDYETATPRHKAIAGLRGRLLPRLRYSLAGRWVAHHEYETDPVDSAFIGADEIPSRFTVDANLMFDVRPNLELGLHARNLFHQVRRHFPLGDEIGSELVLTVRWEF